MKWAQIKSSEFILQTLTEKFWRLKDQIKSANKESKGKLRRLKRQATQITSLSLRKRQQLLNNLPSFTAEFSCVIDTYTISKITTARQ